MNALALVSTTKTLLQNLRGKGWHSLMGKVTLACENNNIPIPDMNATYRNLIQSRKKNNVTIEHHYRVDVFYSVIDRQLVELNSRFNESVTELLRLSVALDPRKSFNIDDICKLVMKYYPLDFTDQEKIQLKAELQHYELDVRNHPSFKKVSKLSALCKGLHDTGKSKSYPLVDRLIRLILTLPVSTASSERAFSAMKIVKTRLRTKMSDDYLKHCFIIYIEREISDTFTTYMIIDAFNSKKKRRVLFEIPKVPFSYLIFIFWFNYI